MSEQACYYVSHETRYDYSQPVGLSRQVLHLRPRPLSTQQCDGFTLAISPEPESLTEHTDAFGNPIASLSIGDSHESFSVRASYRARVSPRSLPPEETTLPWEEVRARLAFKADCPYSTDDFEATRFLFESPRVRNKREIAAFASDSFPEGAPILTGVRRLLERIFSDFVYEPGSTTITTPVMEVLRKRRGVCQDFAHLMLSALRSLGLSARYVSGHLLTHPPPGRERLIGADASHAWVSVYCPGHGWIDADPTNGRFVSNEHITVAWGRDFDDVTPLRGVLVGGGSHKIHVGVTVVPESEYEKLYGEPPPLKVETSERPVQTV